MNLGIFYIPVDKRLSGNIKFEVDAVSPSNKTDGIQFSFDYSTSIQRVRYGKQTLSMLTSLGEISGINISDDYVDSNLFIMDGSISGYNAVILNEWLVMRPSFPISGTYGGTAHESAWTDYVCDENGTQKYLSIYSTPHYQTRDFLPPNTIHDHTRKLILSGHGGAFKWQFDDETGRFIVPNDSSGLPTVQFGVIDTNRIEYKTTPSQHFRIFLRDNIEDGTNPYFEISNQNNKKTLSYIEQIDLGSPLDANNPKIYSSINELHFSMETLASAVQFRKVSGQSYAEMVIGRAIVTEPITLSDQLVTKDYVDNSGTIIPYKQSTSNSLTEINSSGYIAIPSMSMTISASEAGFYKVDFSSYCYLDNPNGFAEYGIFVNDILRTNSVRGMNALSGSKYGTIYTQFMVSLNANDVVTIKIRTTIGSVFIEERNMSAIKLLAF